MRLHSGGISPGLVRLRRSGASERQTPPGRDIRDIRPDQGPQVCVNCKSSARLVQGVRKKRCDPCYRDELEIEAANKKLKALKQPPVGAKSSIEGAPGSKVRRRGDKALKSLRSRAGSAQTKRSTRKSQPGKQNVLPGAQANGIPRPTNQRVCRRCFLELAARGVCDCGT